MSCFITIYEKDKVSVSVLTHLIGQGRVHRVVIETQMLLPSSKRATVGGKGTEVNWQAIEGMRFALAL